MHGSPTAQTKQEETKQTQILPSQKWAPPPKLKNLRSNKRGAKNKQDNMIFKPPRQEMAQRKNSPSFENENVKVTHE